MTATAGTTHHIVLSDGTTALGLMTADNMQSFLRQPVARTALKTGTGDTLYSDLEPPFSTKEQANLAGGRAQKHLRVDPSRFYDTWNVDTRLEGQAILGPKVSLTTLANVGVPEYNPGAVTSTPAPYIMVAQEGGPFSRSGLNGIEQSFTIPPGCTKLTVVELYLSYQTTSTISGIRIDIYADDDGPTGASLGNATIPDDTGVNVDWRTATFDTAITVTPGAVYWLVVSYTGGQFPIYYYSDVNPYKHGQAIATEIESARNIYQRGGGLPKTSDLKFRVYFQQVKLAMSFNYSGSGSYTLAHLQLYLMKRGTVTPTIRIETDDSGPSGTLADANATATLANTDIDGNAYQWVKVDFTDFSLTKGTTYWIVVYDDTQRNWWNMIFWGSDGTASYSGGSAMSKTGSAAWTADSSQDYYFRVNNGQGLTNEALSIFEYKSCLYAVDSPLEGNDAGHLWRNGDRGVAEDNSGDLTTLIDTDQSWTNDEWIGCIVKIHAGPGKGEWRTITDNDATTLTVDAAWTTTHTTNTLYVILGSTKWTDISPASGDQIDTPVTDVLVANGIIYLACGDDQNILRIREYNNSGSWDLEGADDSTNKATLLMEHKQQIWRASSTNQVSYADVAAWGTDLVFGTEIKISTTDYEITSLVVYDSDVWVGKEDSLWRIKQDVPERIPVDFSSLAGPDNCWRMSVWNVYLFFALGYGVERLYGLQVDDSGPNREEGLPDGRQGPIKDLIATPGILYAFIDAGDDGYSSILAYNDMGWHEFVRADGLGKRIRAGHLQVIPGGPNRMWFGCGVDVAYVLMPNKSVNPYKDSRMTYQASGEVITSWVDLHLADIEKYFKDLKIISENLSDTVTITAYYQLDGATDADDWELIGTFTSSPIEEQSIGSAITGRRIRFKFVLATDDNSTTPNLVAWTLDSLARIQPKGRWEPTIKLVDSVTLLDGSTDANSRADILDQLNTWAGSATPLTMTSCDPAQTDVTVFIEDLIETRKKYQTTPSGGGEIVEGEGKLPILEA